MAVIALGGGFGHACRVAAARHTLGLTEPASVLVSSADLPPSLVPGCDLVSPPLELRRDRRGLRAWIGGWLTRHEPDLVWVDAFPAGVLGELVGELAPQARWELLARRLRWDRYRVRLPARPPAYSKVWVTEPLEPAYEQWLRDSGSELAPLGLRDPELCGAVVDEVQLPPGCWLVIHSGPLPEIELLVDQARLAAEGCPIVVIAPGRPSELPAQVVDWLFIAPAAALADRREVVGVVTAGGASSVRQFAARRAQHVAVALPRPLDDQSFRITGMS